MLKSKKLLSLVQVIVIGLFFFSGCEMFTETHTLTIEMNGDGTIIDENENIILDSKENTVDIQVVDNSTITIIAEPKIGWILSEWQGELIEKVDNKVKIHMNRNKKVKAVFKNKKDQLLYYNLSEGYNSLNLPSLSEDENIYTILFSRDNTGAKFNIGSYSTSLEGQTALSGDFSLEENDDSGSGETKVQDQDLCGTSSEYMRKLKKKTIKNHATITARTRNRVHKLDAGPEWEIGDKKEFFVRSEEYVDKRFIEKEAELKGKSENALIWATECAEVEEDDFNFLLDKFEGYRDKIKNIKEK